MEINVKCDILIDRKPIYPKPMLLTTVWAGQKMKKIRYLPNKIGTIREVCTYKELTNEINRGFGRGTSLRYLIDHYHKEIMGVDKANQMIRVAYMDTAENLSVQVHPNEIDAQKINDNEKTECWYILDCDTDSYVYAGTTAKDTEALRVGDKSLLALLTKHAIQPNDFIVIPAGMLHACGKNILALEIGSFGGITYRLYDFERKRKLDVINAIEITDISLSTMVQHYPYTDATHLSNAIKHSAFIVDVVDINGSWKDTSNEKYIILVCVNKQLNILIEDKKYQLRYTETMIIPAMIKDYSILGRGRVLKIYRP